MTGKYRHFKGNEYQVFFQCEDSKGQKFVLYKPLYNDSGYWIRPIDMFFELVERNGKTFKRFEKIEDSCCVITESEITATNSESEEKHRIIKENDIYKIL